MTPPDSLLHLLGSYGSDIFSGLGPALQGVPEVAVRVNTLRRPSIDVEGLESVPWCPEGFYLLERPAFTLDPRLHQGVYYVQDASSMVITAAARMIVARLGADRPLRWLDACAAPGGKTTAVRPLLPPGSHMAANEYVAQRAAILRENLSKAGMSDVAVTSCDTALLAATGPAWHVIAADVPCSGEGMMRKDAEAVAQWSPELVGRCAALQRSILANLWQALLPGGYLIYSTCTFNRTENEDNVLWAIRTLGAEPVSPPDVPQAERAIDPEVEGLRFIPGRQRGEGLFMAILRKPGPQEPAVPASGGKKKERHERRAPKNAIDPALASQVASWLADPSAVTLDCGPDGTLTALMQAPAGLPGARLPLGRVKGKGVVPSQQLALSPMLRPGAFPEADVDRHSALRYLRGEALSVPDAPAGIVLLTHRGNPLGFVKNLGNRANNLYPDPWRILSQLPPDLPPIPF